MRQEWGWHFCSVLKNTGTPVKSHKAAYGVWRLHSVAVPSNAHDWLADLPKSHRYDVVVVLSDGRDYRDSIGPSTTFPSSAFPSASMSTNSYNSNSLSRDFMHVLQVISIHVIFEKSNNLASLIFSTHRVKSWFPAGPPAVLSSSCERSCRFLAIEIRESSSLLSSVSSSGAGPGLDGMGIVDSKSGIVMPSKNGRTGSVGDAAAMEDGPGSAVGVAACSVLATVDVRCCFHLRCSHGSVFLVYSSRRCMRSSARFIMCCSVSHERSLVRMVPKLLNRCSQEAELCSRDGQNAECELLEGGGGSTRKTNCVVYEEWVRKLRLSEKWLESCLQSDR